MKTISITDAEKTAVSKRLLPRPKKLVFDPENNAVSGSLRWDKFCSGFDAAGKLKNLISSELGVSDSGNIALEIIKTPTGSDQGYTLSVTTEKITICAASRAGALYGAMTLRQLKFSKNQQETFPLCTIEDHPSIPLRIAARWTICAECTRSAMDLGDGVENYLRRCREMIDFLMRIKVNAINFDGFRWDTDKFPGYAEEMQRLNEYASDRNIRLSFGGYGIGIGGWGPLQVIAEAHNFLPGFFGDYNRKRYPDGEIYECCGNNPKNPLTRRHGTCRSNDEFLRRMTEKVKQYVSKIRPRCLMVHHEDLATCKQIQEIFWNQRCDECRKRFPDDRFEAFNGAAGAVAKGYNAILEGVAAVKLDGYDGEKDCKVRLASPGYGNAEATDEEWSRFVEYWKNISLQLKYPAIIAVREQFVSGRMENLLETLKQAGDKLSPGGSIVGGADFYTNDALVTASPALCGNFAAASVFPFSGLPFQAVQTVINSEFTWNNDSVWYKIADKGAQELRKNICGKKGYLPEEFTREDDGLIPVICNEIYGPEAGKLMAKLCLLGSDTGVYPASSIYYLFRIMRFFRFYEMRRQENRCGELTYWKQKVKVTIEAAELLEKALNKTNLPDPHREILEHTLRIFKIGIPFSETAALFYEENVPHELIRQKLDEVKKLHPTLFPRNFIAPGNSEAELFPEYIEKLRELLDSIPR